MTRSPGAERHPKTLGELIVGATIVQRQHSSG
jgi:hypothetical protein